MNAGFRLSHATLADLRQSVYSGLAGYEASAMPNDSQPPDVDQFAEDLGRRGPHGRPSLPRVSGDSV